MNGFWFKRKDKYIGKSVILKILKRDDEARPSGQAKSCDSKLPRKASRVNYIGACTGNRHRWSRRES